MTSTASLESQLTTLQSTVSNLEYTTAYQEGLTHAFNTIGFMIYLIPLFLLVYIVTDRWLYKYIKDEVIWEGNKILAPLIPTKFIKDVSLSGAFVTSVLMLLMFLMKGKILTV